MARLTGSHLIEEIGTFNFPVTITNTHSCGVTRDGDVALDARLPARSLESAWGLPMAAETYDGFLNDINGHHVSFEHVAAALDAAAPGPIEEGSVGGGTGMITFGFKAGSGTASRIVEWNGERFMLGVFVQANFGDRRNFICVASGPAPSLPNRRSETTRREPKKARSSRSSPPMRHSCRIR